MTTKEAAAKLCVTPARVRRLVLAGDLPAGKFGRDLFVGVTTSSRCLRPASLAHEKKGVDVRHILVSLLLVLAAVPTAWAQDVSAVELQIERLRAQLRDVVDREAQLQERAARLDEDLRPENVERSVAGVDTTDADALRAKRREELEKQKNDVTAQLTETSAKRTRLEAEIATAEAEAVRLKAAALAPKEAAPRNAPVAAPATPTPAPAVLRRRVPAKKSTPRRRKRPRQRT